MPLASISGNAAAGGAMLAQMQQLLAQRNADQAEQRARVLQEKAQEAQTVADRAQANARNLSLESKQAKGDADQAQRGLAAMSAKDQMLTRLDVSLGKIAQAVTPAAAAPEPVAVPVVNAYGQETGTLVNVTA